MSTDERRSVFSGKYCRLPGGALGKTFYTETGIGYREPAVEGEVRFFSTHYREERRINRI